MQHRTNSQLSQARIQDCVQGFQAEFWPQGGALSPKLAQNRGFSLKIAWNLHDFEQNLGARLEAGPPGRPLDLLSLPGFWVWNTESQNAWGFLWLSACVVWVFWQTRSFWWLQIFYTLRYHRLQGGERLFQEAGRYNPVIAQKYSQMFLNTEDFDLLQEITSLLISLKFQTECLKIPEAERRALGFSWFQVSLSKLSQVKRDSATTY